MIEKAKTCRGLNVKLPECLHFVLTRPCQVWLRRASFSASQRPVPEVTDIAVEEEIESVATCGTWENKVLNICVKLGNEP